MDKQVADGLGNDKIREEFEAAIVKNQLAGGFPPANFERCGLDGRYVVPELEAAWWGWLLGWLASRAAIDVELPARVEPTSWESYANHHNNMLDVFEKALEAAGLRGKP